jgi:4-hydroxy-tetrahydrodipicolinate synthase
MLEERSFQPVIGPRPSAAFWAAGCTIEGGQEANMEIRGKESLQRAAIGGSGEPPAVYPVPPLARKRDSRRSLDFVQNEKILQHLKKHGVTNVVYGGNAFLYHVTLSEYHELIEWADSFTPEFSIVPAVGPSYGRAMDQAPLVRKHRFSSVLVLPCGDPRDATGLETGLREIAEACGVPLSVYIKHEGDFGPDREAGLDAVGRLVDTKVCGSIKYAVVRKDPKDDAYLTSLLRRVPADRVISGIGERPAIVHLRDFKLNGFTTGSGVLAPRLSRDLLSACLRKDYAVAEEIWRAFLPLEDLRDAWGAAPVLHACVEAAGVAETGPVPPFVSAVPALHVEQLRHVARALLERNG